MIDRPSSPPASRQVAVIDIGSNSVRLVIYRLEGRAIWTVFNEKVLAGLGRDLQTTGRLSEPGVVMALEALRRFGVVLDGVGATQTFVVATAAVREAEDGAQFCELVAAQSGLAVRVLSGEDEARYAALGVIAGEPNARGVSGDLGGASLELTRIEDGRPAPGVTLPLGPFSLSNGKTFNADRVRRLAMERLALVADRFQVQTLHAVGGAWRTLAQVHMAMCDYPLQIVHQYKMTADQAREVAGLIARQSSASLEKTPGVSRKRAETLPYAAVVLDALIESLGLEMIRFSAWGVREGVLFETLSEAEQATDPLMAGADCLGVRQGVSPTLPGALWGWLNEVSTALPEVFGADRDARLTRAACLYADIGARLHPDHRVELAFDQVLRAPIPGQTHRERAYLASAINARYGGSTATPEPDLVTRLLDDRARRRARALGLAIRLASDLSARSPQLLANTALRLDGDGLLLTAQDGYSALLLGEQTAKRANALAQTLDTPLRIG